MPDMESHFAFPWIPASAGRKVVYYSLFAFSTKISIAIQQLMAILDSSTFRRMGPRP